MGPVTLITVSMSSNNDDDQFKTTLCELTNLYNKDKNLLITHVKNKILERKNLLDFIDDTIAKVKSVPHKSILETCFSLIDNQSKGDDLLNAQLFYIAVHSELALLEETEEGSLRTINHKGFPLTPDLELEQHTFIKDNYYADHIIRQAIHLTLIIIEIHNSFISFKAKEKEDKKKKKILSNALENLCKSIEEVESKASFFMTESSKDNEVKEKLLNLQTHKNDILENMHSLIKTLSENSFKPDSIIDSPVSSNFINYGSLKTFYSASLSKYFLKNYGTPRDDTVAEFITAIFNYVPSKNYAAQTRKKIPQ